MQTLGIILLLLLVLSTEQATAFPPAGSKDLQTLQTQANQGNAEAQNGLGELYAKGKGMPQDYAQARAWYEKAAAQGHPHAQNNLAELYFAGLGMPQDYVRAYMWVNLAATHMKGEDKKQAEENRDDVARLMTPAQIAEAKQLSEHCRSKQFKGC
ncbi:MAG: sel1 repeat family protein [Nitrospira sp.]|nr:sel1 repeat family protein [Nitrospira sp.]MDH4304573.1 sel1 repeat family protein [Nitrospira sp.]MDH5194834.1 sel1 repeat family protein [Nitrospira sp.]